MWQIRRFAEIFQEDDLDSALKATIKHIKVTIHRMHKKILIRAACDIRQTLPKTTVLPHPTGIVIGTMAKIGNNVKIYQNVTVGSNIESGLQPTIEDDVVLCSGAVIIGDVNIGRNSIVGANSVVINDIPSNSIAVGAPAKVVAENN